MGWSSIETDGCPTPGVTSVDNGSPRAEREQSEMRVHHSRGLLAGCWVSLPHFHSCRQNFCLRDEKFAYAQPSKQFELEVCEFFLHTRSFRGVLRWVRWVVLMQRSHVTTGDPELGDSYYGRQARLSRLCPGEMLYCSANKSAACPICRGCSLYKNPWTDSPAQRTPVLMLTRCAPMRPWRMVS